MLKWSPQALRAMITEQKITKVGVCDKLSISRPTLDNWLSGKVAPKGKHLILLSKLFNISPNDLFIDETIVAVPMHRTNRNKELKDQMKMASTTLAAEYEILFRNAPDPIISDVLKVSELSSDNVLRVAKKLRTIAGINDPRPLQFNDILKICARLDISVIFREFDDEIDSYAFFVSIGLHRVIFVNTNITNVDLVFPVLHEVVHAIQDGEPHREATNEEEKFCDAVASEAQLPNEYIKYLVLKLKKIRSNVGMRVNFLKLESKRNRYSLFGLSKILKKNFPRLNVGNIEGSATKINQSLGPIRQKFEEQKTASDLVSFMQQVSPNFINFITQQHENFSDRKIAELFGLSNQEDGTEIRETLDALSSWDSYE